MFLSNTTFFLFDGRGVFTLLPKVQLRVSALENSHLQVVHESLESSHTRFLRIHVQPENGYLQEPKHLVYLR